MNKKKFTVRVGADALRAAKDYAKEHDTTLTNLVDEFFQSIHRVREINRDTPILYKLAGSLHAEASLEGYYAHLEKNNLGETKPNVE